MLRCEILDGIKEGMDTSGGRWQVVCRKHGAILSVDTKKQARADADSPEEFCDECREEA